VTTAPDTPLQPAAPSSPAADPDATFSQKIRDINAGEVAFAGRDVNFLLGPQEPVRDLSSEHFNKPLEPQDLVKRTEGMAFASEEVDRLQDILIRRRLLVIAGEREMGKETMALLLALRLGADGVPRQTLLAEGLAPQIRVSLDKVAGDSRTFGGKTVIFQDAFGSRNRDLVRFIHGLDTGRLDQLRSRLESSGTYVIFTSDSNRLPGDQILPRLQSLSVLHELRGPEPGEILRFVSRKAQRLTLNAAVSRTRVETFLTQSQRVIDELRTIPRIVSFLDTSLLQILAEDMELDEALRRFRHRADWLLTDLAEDPEAWGFVLALVLAQSTRAVSEVPWFQLQSLWQVLCRHLRRELRSFGPARLVLDSAFLEKVSAEIRRSPFSSDCVRFRAPIDPEALWEHLLGPGRSLLGSVVPVLRELAEGSDFTLRECAARALGRIGRIDPRHVTYPLIHDWFRAPSESQHAALGQLFQGILASGDAEYREVCLYQLRRTIWNGHHVSAAAVALSEVGCVDLGLALGDLVEMLSGILGDQVGHPSPENREILQHIERRQRLGAAVLHEGVDWVDGGRRLALRLLFTDAEQTALAAAQYALVGLCFALDPVDVLAELRERLTCKAEGKLLPVLALLFLRAWGIADILDGHKLPVLLTGDSEGSAKTVRLSELVVALSHGAEAVRSLGLLVKTVFQGAGTFPGWVCRSFRSRLGDLLKSWAQESLEVSQIRDACADLFAELLAASDLELKALVFRLLKHDPDFTDAGKPLGQWALDVLTRIPSGRPSWREVWTATPTSSP